MSENSVDILSCIDEKISLAQELISKIEKDFIDIVGARKTKKNLENEIKGLLKLKENCNENTLLKLKCSNVSFYIHLVNSLYRYQENNKIIAIQQTRESLSGTKLLIHIICDSNNIDNDQLWIKIISRDPNALELTNLGFGHKDIIEIAEDYKDCALNSIYYRPPKVIFDFMHQINEDLEAVLEEKGIIIGRKYYNESYDNMKTFNFDVSGMIAYVSELCNGGANIVFNQKFFDMQAKEERSNPARKLIDRTIEGKRIIACKTAVESFQEIIDNLGGENEKTRAGELLSKLEILPDLDNVESVLNVDLSTHIKDRSRKIFAFGIYHSAITITANQAFSRAVKMYNINIPVICCGARALTETKTPPAN